MDYLSIKEAAEKLQVSIPTLRRYIKKGEIGVLKFDRDYKFTQQAINKFIEDRTKSPKESKPEHNDKKEDKEHKDHKHGGKAPAIFHGINSHILETVSELSSEISSIDELKNIIKDHAQECISLIENIEKEGVNNTKTAINLLLLDEAIKNLQLRRSLFGSLIQKQALILLPLPPHLSDPFLSVAPIESVFSVERIMPPHLKHSHYPFFNFINPLEIKEKFGNITSIVTEGYFEHNMTYIRREAAQAIYLLGDQISNVFIHSIPHIPPHSQFEPINIGNKISFI